MSVCCPKCGSQDVYSSGLLVGVARVKVVDAEETFSYTIDELSNVDFEVKPESVKYASCERCHAQFNLEREGVRL